MKLNVDKSGAVHPQMSHNPIPAPINVYVNTEDGEDESLATSKNNKRDSIETVEAYDQSTSTQHNRR